MGDMTLIRFIEEFLAMGYRVEFEHVGGGVYTEVVITKTDNNGDKYDNLLAKNIPSNHLRDSDMLNELKSEASALMV